MRVRQRREYGATAHLWWMHARARDAVARAPYARVTTQKRRRVLSHARGAADARRLRTHFADGDDDEGRGEREEDEHEEEGREEERKEQDPEREKGARARPRERRERRVREEGEQGEEEDVQEVRHGCHLVQGFFYAK